MINNVINVLQNISDNEILNKFFFLSIRIIVCIFAFAIGCIIIKIIKKLIKNALKKSKVDEGVQGFIISLIAVCLYFVLGLFLASGMGVDAASIVAILGSAGVAIGLAIQGSLSNLAGGLLLLILRPFKVGDYIIEDSQKNEGIVKEIGLFYTKLQTLDEKTVILPNGNLANTSITNVTQTPERMLEIKFTIAYSADLDKAYDVIRKVMLEDMSYIPEKGVETYMTALLDSSVEIAGRCYVHNDDYRFARQRILENVKRGFDSAGIEIPFPQIDVHNIKN